MEQTKENGIFIPYDVEEDYNLSFKCDLSSRVKLLENTSIVQASVLENLKPTIIKNLQLVYVAGLRLGNNLDDLETDNEIIDEEFRKILKKIFK